MEKSKSEKANQARIALRFATDAVIANPKLSYEDVFIIAENILINANERLDNLTK